MRNDRRLWVLVAVFSAAVLVGLGTLDLYMKATAEPASAEKQPPKAKPRLMAKAPVQNTPPPEVPDQPDHHFDTPFATAVDRLNHAFQNQTDMSVEDVLFLVNSKVGNGQPSPCPLSWHDNAVTIQVPSNQLQKISPTDVITTCAAAIEQLR